MILSNTHTNIIKLPTVVRDNFCFNFYLHNVSLLRFVNFAAYDIPPTIKSLMRRRASDGLGAITAPQIARANPSVARARVLAFARPCQEGRGVDNHCFGIRLLYFYER